MKLTIRSIILCLAVLTMACGSSQKTATEDNVNVSNPGVDNPALRNSQGRVQGQLQQQYQEMIAMLELTPEQETEFSAITRKYREKMQTIRQNNQGDFQAMRSEMQTLRQEQNEELKAILTVEQFEKYQNYVKEQRENRRGRRGNGNG